jgi:membrane-associated phospholipid phosphatase
MAKNWSVLLLGIAILTALVCVSSLLLDDELDYGLLAQLNLDHPVPLLDDLMIAVTKYSIPGFVLVLLSWFVASRFSVRNDASHRLSVRALRALGVVGGCATASAALWAGRELPGAMVLTGILLATGFWLVSRSLPKPGDAESAARVRLAFLLTILAVLLAELSAEVVVKQFVSRARPLHRTHVQYRHALRRLDDEAPKRGNSYVSGHAVFFFAAVTPLVLLARRRSTRVALGAWAVAVAYSRLYVAAHFLTCVVVGAAMGIGIGLAVVVTLAPAALPFIGNRSRRPRIPASACAPAGPRCGTCPLCRAQQT